MLTHLLYKLLFLFLNHEMPVVNQQVFSLSNYSAHNCHGFRPNNTGINIRGLSTAFVMISSQLVIIFKNIVHSFDLVTSFVYQVIKLELFMVVL